MDRKALLKTVLKALVSVALIYWLISKKALDFEAFGRILNPISFFIGMFVVIMGVWLNNYRWYVLLKSQGFQHSVKQTFQLSLIGLFFNFMVPGGVGGDVVKGAYLVSGQSSGRLKPLLTILLDRIFGLYALILMATVACAFNFQEVIHSDLLKNIFYVLVLLCVGLTFGLALAITQGHRLAHWVRQYLPYRILNRVVELLELLHSYSHHPATLFKCVGLTFLSQPPQILFFWYVGQLLGIQLPLNMVFFLVPLGICSMVLPIAPAGVGVGQASLYFLFKAYRPGTENVGTLGMTSLQIYTFILSLVGAFLFLRRRRPQIAKEPLND